MSFDTTPEGGKHKRKHYFDKARRVVVKVGSAVLSNQTKMNTDVIFSLARDISALHDNGRQIILVSSGAVAAGRQKIKEQGEKDLSLQEKQALAAIGQSYLMQIYDSAFAQNHKEIAQILLTHADLAHRERYLNFKNTIFTLFKMGVVPIINENDTVSTEELQFGDNDNLGALVTNLVGADLFICLTDVDGLYTANPIESAEAKQVYTVAEVTPLIENMAGHSTSVLGTGGMSSKINAAKKVAYGGGASFIGPGKCQGILQKLFAGEMYGTFFLPRRKRLKGKKQWIAYVLKPKGKITLDSGACEAISTGGKSVLPSGVVDVRGDFTAGEAVQCCDAEGNIFAVGLANYRAADVNRIMGKKSDKIEHILGFKDSDVIIHRDNLVIL